MKDFICGGCGMYFGLTEPSSIETPGNKEYADCPHCGHAQPYHAPRGSMISNLVAEETEKIEKSLGMLLTREQKLIRKVTQDMDGFLIEKNRAYGNSAFEPANIFSKVDAEEQLKVRVDDKLNRLKRGSEFQGDDTVKDLCGYLILLMAVREKKKLQDAGEWHE